MEEFKRFSAKKILVVSKNVIRLMNNANKNTSITPGVNKSFMN